jgi:hypothetical protein
MNVIDVDPHDYPFTPISHVDEHGVSLTTPRHSTLNRN